MTEEQRRIVATLEKAVSKLSTVSTKQEYQEMLRYIGAVASHEAKKTSNEIEIVCV